MHFLSKNKHFHQRESEKIQIIYKEIVIREASEKLKLYIETLIQKVDNNDQLFEKHNNGGKWCQKNTKKGIMDQIMVDFFWNYCNFQISASEEENLMNSEKLGQVQTILGEKMICGTVRYS